MKVTPPSGYTWKNLGCEFVNFSPSEKYAVFQCYRTDNSHRILIIDLDEDAEVYVYRGHVYGVFDNLICFLENEEYIVQFESSGIRLIHLKSERSTFYTYEDLRKDITTYIASTKGGEFSLKNVLRYLYSLTRSGFEYCMSIYHELFRRGEILTRDYDIAHSDQYLITAVSHDVQIDGDMISIMSVPSLEIMQEIHLSVTFDTIKGDHFFLSENEEYGIVLIEHTILIVRLENGVCYSYTYSEKAYGAMFNPVNRSLLFSSQSEWYLLPLP